METVTPINLFDTNSVDGVLVVHLVDSYMVQAQSLGLVSQQFEKLLAGSTHFVLDFESVEHLCSAMIGELIRFSKLVQAKGGHLILCSLKPQIHEVFRLLRLEKMFPISTDAPSAIRALR